MAIKIFHVDAFTDRPFRGNPAAVCLLDAPRDESWMRQLAGEMNLSETAFVVPGTDGYSLRWFTPEVEVDLCGHATLASAHVLWQIGREPATGAVRFQTRSGVLEVRRRDAGWIVLDFPALTVEPGPVPVAILESIGVQPRATAASGSRVLVEVDDEETVRRLAPDFTRMLSAPGRSLMVTAQGRGPEYDFVSRYFAPWVGVNEDPVTGVAHCSLAPYWSARLGKTSMRAFQASSRGGEVRVEVRGDRVLLSGQAVTVTSGTLADGTLRPT